MNCCIIQLIIEVTHKYLIITWSYVLPSTIDCIIFDLGRVIVDVDLNATLDAFKKIDGMLY